MTVYIVAQGSYCENVAEELPPLKSLVKDVIGHAVPRTGRFTQLALIGAGAAGQDLPAHSAVYLSSGLGDVAATTEVLDAIYRDRQAPRPLSFIKTVSNAACFHVARELDIEGASIFVSNRYFAVEMCLKTALLDLQFGHIESALVGVVDIVVAPIAEHRERCGLPAGALLAEASHCLQLVAEPGPREVLAALESICQFPDRESLLHWWHQQPGDSVSSLALGQYMPPDEGAQWLAETGLPHFEYGQGIGHFDSRAGMLIREFIERGSQRLLYINRDPHGRYVAMLLARPGH